MEHILDCTMRDGGYVNNWNFSKEQAQKCYEAALESGISYCEVGFRRTPDGGSFGPWYYAPESLLNDTFVVQAKCKLAVMAQMGTFTISDFVPKSESLVSMVRILIPYHCKNKDDTVLDTDIICDTVNMCKSLRELGYETSINIGRIDKLSENQIHDLCLLIRDAPIKYLYVADTYGNLGIYKMRKIIATLKQYYTGAIGFHAHDNLQNASIKSIDALYNGASIVDVTFGGYGRGSGNAKAELVIAHMIMSGSEEYKLLPALVYADKYVQKYTQSGVVYLLTGMTSMHVNYAIEVIEKWSDLSIEKVYDTFGKIVESGKHNFYFPDVFTHALL